MPSRCMLHKDMPSVGINVTPATTKISRLLQASASEARTDLSKSLRLESIPVSLPPYTINYWSGSHVEMDARDYIEWACPEQAGPR